MHFVKVLWLDLLRYMRPLPRLLALVPLWLGSGWLLYWILPIACTISIPYIEVSSTSSTVRLFWAVAFLYVLFMTLVLRTFWKGMSLAVFLFETLRLIALVTLSVLVARIA